MSHDRDLEKEIALHKIMRKWMNILKIETYSFNENKSGETIFINFCGYEVDCIHPDELLNMLSLFHSEVRNVLGNEIKIRYLKSFPMWDNLY